MQKQVKKNILTGILILLPLWITFFIILIFTRWVSNIARPFVAGISIYVLGIENEIFIRFISFFVSMFLIYSIGLLANNIFGKKILSLIENMLENIPLIKDIYISSKRLINFIFEYNRYKWNKVVLIEYPRKGIYSIGIVTTDFEKMNRVGLFVPSTPNPTTGFFIFVNKNDIINTSLSIEDALKVVVSGGVISSEELEKYLQ